MIDKTFFISFKNLYNTELDRPIFHDDDHDKKKKLIIDVLLGSNLKTSFEDNREPYWKEGVVMRHWTFRNVKPEDFRPALEKIAPELDLDVFWWKYIGDSFVVFNVSPEF